MGNTVTAASQSLKVECTSHRSPPPVAKDLGTTDVDSVAHAALYEELFPNQKGGEAVRVVGSLSVAGSKHASDSGLAPAVHLFLENCSKPDYGGYMLFPVVQNNYGQGLTIRKVRPE